MKALQIEGGYGLEKLTLVDRPAPKPGQGEVVVRTRAISLNFRDLLTVTGMYGGNYQLPLVPFGDACGIVEEVGPGVSDLKVGDRVSTLFFSDTWIAGPPTPERLSGALGGPRDGCAQELFAISQHGVVKPPAHLTDHQVATLPCAALTAWRALVVDGDVKAGDVVVLQGTGGVSIFGLQFAKAMGCEVIITSSSDEKLSRAKAMGADHVINYKTTPDWGAEVRRITKGRGADLVLEVGGAKTLMESLKCVRQQGHVAIIGVLSGPAEAMPMLIPTLIWTNARVQGLSVGSRDNFIDMCRAIELHKISPVVDQTHDWKDAAKALQAMMGQGHFGKIVLTF
jgi:NADPH:quinone reductase-like Zn-dependent oxidoreductase